MVNGSRMENEIQREAIRTGYQYTQILCHAVGERFPDGDTVDVNEEIRWNAEQLTDDPEERAELLPYVAHGFRQGTMDLLYRGTHRYSL